ncbi:short chain type dehydrogenase, putative [Talaromyces stipitatus ATCC 10500]|uniref:Short chain type dehydrogenase, putative n=1 Tax=Talaromyces stipitatus (strain ATCC 10500 / CBS 375.48 / QM 6759 / NRRL 1006) TaxID=441959 RepID=B8M3Z6_TALSN|nr:short chain type dehydrogenase, putative [Talaromyces stipitatus ATCC 10500]EED20739.1 short chain type dehydrogenase, putative [Talaromyces stipitatus ATCC 10500]
MMELFSLTGKTALITGASRGIGQAMAVALAEAGADIVLIQRDLYQNSTKEAIEKAGRTCLLVKADLSNRKNVQGLIASVVKDRRIDIMVNNAGIMHRMEAADFTEDAFDEVMEVNFNCTFFLCRDIGRYWIENRIDGRLINTASLATFQGGVRMAAYSASKGAIGQLTKALSNEWAKHNIRVNAIAPGYIATDMNIDTRTNPDQAYYESILSRIPIGHWGKPEDFKGPIVFLASDASSYISGQIITVDGGWMAR